MMAQYYIWFRIWWRYSHQKDTIYYLQTTYCGHIWTHGCEKTNVGHIEVPLPYSIPTRSPLSAFHDALEYQTLSKLHHRRRSYDVISIFKMVAAVAQFYFRFRIGWRRFLQKVNVYQRTTFRQNNSINGRDITISSLEKTRSPYWNSSSGFDLDYITVIRMIFCTQLPNFIHIVPPNAETWRHMDFSRWRPRLLNSSSSFPFIDISVFRRSMAISKPNFVDIPQFTAEL